MFKMRGEKHGDLHNRFYKEKSHGPLSGKRDLEDMKAYILMFDKMAKELASRTDDVKKTAEALQGSLPQRPEGAWLIAPNVQMKYLKKQ